MALFLAGHQISIRIINTEDGRGTEGSPAYLWVELIRSDIDYESSDLHPDVVRRVDVIGWPARRKKQIIKPRVRQVTAKGSANQFWLQTCGNQSLAEIARGHRAKILNVPLCPIVHMVPCLQ